MNEKSFEAVPVPASVTPLRFDAERCIGCLRCVEICPMDILLPPEEKGLPPRVMWPGECWYCGACVMECPVQGAVTLRHPLMNQASFVERDLLGTSCHKG